MSQNRNKFNLPDPTISLQKAEADREEKSEQARIGGENRPAVKDIILAIRAYNQNHPEEKIQFLHGGSSAPLSYIGRTVTVTHDNDHETKKVPPELIPTGRLRKEYGIVPASGELDVGTVGMFGNRKEGINYTGISGATANHQGVSVTYSYSTTFTKLKDADVINQQINHLLSNLNERNYIRALKLLLMHFTNLMLLDPDGEKKGVQYIETLVSKIKELQNNAPDATMERYLNKYKSKFENILSGKSLPFAADKQFRTEIFDQVPVIYASTVKGEKFGDIYGEQIFKNTIPFSTIKLMFTPEPFVAQLKAKLNSLGLKNIEVHGYKPEMAPKKEMRNPLSETGAYSPAHTLFEESATKSSAKTKPVDKQQEGKKEIILPPPPPPTRKM